MLLNLILSPNISLFAIALFVLGFIFSIGFHEYSHAKSAQLFGDLTPYYQGRVTLNPLAHLDPVGTFLMFFAPFGWGKPVEVNPNNMGDHPERKYFISSIVGPISNIVLAIGFFLITWGYVTVFKSTNLTISVNDYLSFLHVFELLIVLNIGLAIFNLLPIPPLDGSKIWSVILPYNARIKIEPIIQKYGFILLIAMIIPIIPSASGTTSVIGLITSPILTFIIDLISNVLS